jgi:hypothetical protein
VDLVPQPVHDPLVSLATWQAAQATGGQRGNVRDTEKPTVQPGSRYILRSRIRHQACQRRMYGIRRPTTAKATTGAEYTYYHCPYNPSNPRHLAAHPDHSGHSVSIREETIITAICDFLTQWVFSHDWAAKLAALIPATDAEHAAAQARREAQLRAELDQISTAQAGLMTELARLGGDTSPATQAYRERIQAHHADLHGQCTATQAQLDELTATATPDQDPTLLDELPYLTGLLDTAPVGLVAGLLDALDIQVLYRPEQDQATIWATLTDTITALLADPRVTASQPSPGPSAQASPTVPHFRVGTRPYRSPSTPPVRRSRRFPGTGRQPTYGTTSPTAAARPPTTLASVTPYGTRSRTAIRRALTAPSQRQTGAPPGSVTGYRRTV